jgi:predicted NBD/HSP70 family sugar kinase
MIDGGAGGSGLYLGLEIGGTKLQVFTGDACARIVERHRFNVDPSSGGAGIRAQLEQVIPVLAKRVRPAAVRRLSWLIMTRISERLARPCAVPAPGSIRFST